jgi:hypothetical protein
MAWSHIQLFYHATKDSHMGTTSLYSSKGYPSFRVPTVTFMMINDDGITMTSGISSWREYIWLITRFITKTWHYL